jgi:uncharacterized protein with HEPN domain
VPSSDPIQRFQDILANIDRIEKHTAGMDATTFLEDLKTYDAVERCLERISEAAKKLGSVAGELCPGIPWPELRGIGNVLRHEYDRIEGIRLWTTVERDLPALKIAVEAALQKLLRKEATD